MASRKYLRLIASAMSVSMVVAACGSDAKKADTTTAASTPAAGSTATADSTAGSVAAGTCDESAGDKTYAGKTVSIFSSIRDIEADRLEAAWSCFEKQTGIDIQHEGSGAFEADLKVRVDGGNAPDLAFIPQPGLLATLARDGKLTPLTNLEADVASNDIDGWVGFGSVDGKFYAPPFGANIKSLVWYSPAKFKEGGYEIPTTWQAMLDLSQKMVDDGKTPWCVGAGSDQATGWVITDWLEDAVLRFAGADVYDKWVAHEIKFNDPAIVNALDQVGAILKNNDFVLNGSQSIPSTTFQEAGLPLLDGGCYMHRQANFYGNQFPEGTTKGPDGQVNTFYFPTVKADDPKVMLGGGELIGAFNAKPEVELVAKYLTGADYANNRLAQGNWMTPNKNADPSLVVDPLERTFAELLVSSDVFRFDGSDLMPSAVGAGTFWTEMVAWVTGKSTEDALKAIDASWPAS
ncbi:MAG: ABC transporter substrate-binding protein [Ilumatobacteraceae bacterium]